ncbi:hypothetical protein [Piscinibacter terrae]|uniref:Uncharacterized protein n=1 Tax=Piscinibacter terrae TaxID=2496871 RepID=A0A3N7HLP2_9BURK|nr:hypothetical protein [Albitalea terrae]RQP21956.1 hypothetical protein DZC73_26370 [Albitalea terrae]
MSTTKVGSRAAKTTKTTPRKAAAAKKPAAKPATSMKKPAPAKAAPQPKTQPATQAAPEAAKLPKTKLVRDSFTMPKPEYQVIDTLKDRSAKAGRPLKKSEVLRAGIKALAAMSDEAFAVAIADVPALKTGRPKSKKPSAPAQQE